MLRFVFLAVLTMNISARAEDVVSADKVGPWDLAKLKRQVPEMRWVDRTHSVHSLLYEGEEYEGHPTEVFAYYASPVTLGEAEPGGTFSGVVLIHGGGGTAFADWTWQWAQRGYAAIAMDLSGSRPPDPVFDMKTGAPDGHHRHDRTARTRLANGGPDQGHGQKFDSIGGSTSDDWPFHAVASAIRAHTLLRSFPEVDESRTAVTGISWGGYTTCLVASLDDRFAAAVPVYGCGFLHEGESVQKPSIDRLGDRQAEWVRRYDPSSLLPRCRVPILFVNGTNDINYPLDSYMKSYDLVTGPKQMRVTVAMPHSHPDGWAPREIGMFIDAYCKGGVPLPVPAVVSDGGIRVPVASSTSLKKAAVHYTVDSGSWRDREWQSVAARIDEGTITADAPPAETTAWFVTATDERDAVVSTSVVIRP